MKKLNFKNIENKDAKNFMEIKNINNGVAELYIYGQICSSKWDTYEDTDDICPADVREFLKDLENITELKIYINSPGGSVFGGLGIYNQLKRFNCKKTVYIDGMAGSIASVIALVGDEVIMPLNSQMMIHKPLVALFGFYNSEDFIKITKSLDACQNSILEIYKENLIDCEDFVEIENMVNSETYLSADLCSKYFKNVKIESEKQLFIENVSEEKIVNDTEKEREKEKRLLEIACI